MTRSSVNTQRNDPYKNFKFRVKWGGRYVAGFAKVSALNRSTEVVQHREDGEQQSNHKAPARMEFEAITLERGITHDQEFEAWANSVQNLAAARDTSVSLDDVRKDLIIEVHDETGQLVLSYTVFGCWVSEYQALSDLDANGNAVAIGTLKLENDGWKRSDTASASAGPDATVSA